MLHDAGDMNHTTWSDQLGRDEEHDQVGTVEVQILLSWFFESSTPDELHIEVPPHDTSHHGEHRHMPRAA